MACDYENKQINGKMKPQDTSIESEESHRNPWQSNKTHRPQYRYSKRSQGIDRICPGIMDKPYTCNIKLRYHGESYKV